ncbi:hypothetical protein VCHA53O466_320022 [Vibrio chagasii]|nr:hypothetical protein VCHA53O466_320022 [Vibrio chagasii]
MYSNSMNHKLNMFDLAMGSPKNFFVKNQFGIETKIGQQVDSDTADIIKLASDSFGFLLKNGDNLTFKEMGERINDNCDSPEAKVVADTLIKLDT